MSRARRAVCAAVAALLLAASAPAQEPPEERLSSFLGGRVSFTLPRAWDLRRHVGTPERGRAELAIPYAAADRTPHRATAELIANTVPEKVTVRHLSDGVYENLYEGLAVTSDTFDGDDWRTMVWTTRDRGVPYAFLHRFGLVGRTSVELLVAFPLLEGGDPKWVEQTVADFNALCAGLRIDGRNKFDSPVKLDQLPRPQKANPKP